MALDYILIGSRIRECRIMQNMTLNVLAEQVGLTPASLRHIETGFSKPSLQTLYHIVDILDISLDYATGRTASPSETMTQQYGLNDQQQAAIQNFLVNIVPIITDHV